MPNQVTILNVFLASPSDVKLERELVEDIISELNQSYFRSQNVGLNLLRWETDTHPGFGEDAQDVINNQIRDYDIFIGILWSRFGSPTKRAQSGTEEEFQNAYKRFKKQRDIKILFYFKNKPISIDDIDIDQISLIKNFKQELESLGGYYWNFNETNEFERDLRKHLISSVKDFIRNYSKSYTIQPEIIDEPDESEFINQEINVQTLVEYLQKKFPKIPVRLEVDELSAFPRFLNRYGYQKLRDIDELLADTKDAREKFMKEQTFGKYGLREVFVAVGLKNKDSRIDFALPHDKQLLEKFEGFVKS